MCSTMRSASAWVTPRQTRFRFFQSVAMISFIADNQSLRQVLAAGAHVALVVGVGMPRRLAAPLAPRQHVVSHAIPPADKNSLCKYHRPIRGFTVNNKPKRQNPQMPLNDISLNPGHL